MVKKAPPEFQRLTRSDLTILVGLTGVGKTTVLKLLQESGLDFTLLPNRREITDAVIIPTLQREAGETVQPINDRVGRFEYTAQYRKKYPGGMAYALSQLAIAPEKTNAPLLFDGLRGLNEVQYAVTYFPAARFVVLDAPDMVRLNRLLKRDDSFDKTKIQTSLLGKNILAALMGVPNIEAIFNEKELQQIAKAARVAGIPIDTVVQTARIIVEERRNYDSRAARVHLVRSLPVEQVLVIDTADQTVEAVTQQIAGWL